MIKLFILVGFFFCVKAFAGYECELSLLKTDQVKTLTNKTIKAKDSDLRSINMDDFFADKLSLKVFISGWSGEEEINVSVFKKGVQVSEKITLRGDAQDDLWFENYKLETRCSIN